ncbi:MAG: peptidase M75 [Acaryochloris sp. RU_4_1]|nr:peptidase M75 [Acaryochloris sp. RU_4_1]
MFSKKVLRIAPQLQISRVSSVARGISITSALAMCLLIGTGCQEASKSGTEANQEQSTNAPAQSGQTLVAAFPEQVVIPTYERLVTQSEKMVTAVDAFVANPSDSALKAAQEAWTEARVPWEQSEAFAFGPATSLGYDGDLDDWPVNETDVTAVIKDTKPINLEFVSSLQTTQKGFHTLELLLFGAENNKKAADFSPREREYLKTLAAAFDQTAKALKQSWTEGVQGKPAYKTVLATAGEKDNTAYPTKKAAVEEVVQGIIGCLDEVGNEKIGVPLKAKTTDDLESRFSHTSLADFKNNVQSAQIAYLGGTATEGPQQNSLSAWVAKNNPELDTQVQKELEAALTALEAVPDPVEKNMTDAAALAKLKTAQEAVLTSFATFEGKVLPLVKEKA